MTAITSSHEFNSPSASPASLKKFFEDVAPVLDATKYCSMHYIGRVENNDIIIEKARLRLINTSSVSERTFHEFEIAAGEFNIADYGIDPYSAINSLVNGCMISPHGKLIFASDPGQNIEVKYDDIHLEGLQNQNRLSVMTLRGENSALQSRQPQVDWLLRAASTPYFSLQELAFDFNCGLLDDKNTVIDIIADNTLFIDNQSEINENTAHLWVRMAKQLNTDDVTLGYRLLVNGKVIDRKYVLGSQFRWETDKDVLRGNIRITVPSGSIMQCFANYRDIARHFYWVGDPTIAQNTRRSIFEIFDGGLDILQDFLFRDHTKGRDARDFETGIAWLLWLLGFSVLHLGKNEKTRDAADLIATTPKGDYVVVECTTGLLKAEHKVASLVERATKIRKRLASSGNSYLRVLPVIVTSRTRDEIAAEIDQTRALGVVVVTREDITDSLGRTLLIPNANDIFEESMESVYEKEIR